VETRSPPFIYIYTCDINVVLNAMVKVNQAAILVASPGQPRHQPIKQQNLFFLFLFTANKKNKKNLNIIGINPSSGSSPVRKLLRVDVRQKKRPGGESVFSPPSKLSKR